MKRNLLFAILFSLFTLNLFSQNLCTGLVGDFTFTGNTLDSSGFNNNAIVWGAVPIAGKAGIPNTAYHFNGTNNYMEVPDAISLHLDSAITIHVVFKSEAFNLASCQSNSLVCKWSTLNGGSGFAATFTDNVVDYDCNASDTTIDIFLGSTSNNNWFQGLYDYHDYIHSDIWYCATFIQSADTQKIYLNGVLKSSHYVPNNIGITSVPMWFGRGSTGISDFTGVIDEIKIYNRGLSDQEVNDLCTGTPCNGTTIGIFDHSNDDKANLKIYPNPNSGSFKIDFENIKTNEIIHHIEVVNMIGKIVYNGNLGIINGKLMDVITIPNEINNGIYIVNLFINNNVFHTKINVQK